MDIAGGVAFAPSPYQGEGRDEVNWVRCFSPLFQERGAGVSCIEINWVSCFHSRGHSRVEVFKKKWALAYYTIILIEPFSSGGLGSVGELYMRLA
jgi:hypothetical protein